MEIVTGGMTDHLTVPFHQAGAVSSAVILGELPYGVLSGHDFERLIYEILVDTGRVPRFFGINGQKQRGIDLVAEVNSATVVYQCKNYVKLTNGDIDQILAKFEEEWLPSDLPRPAEFVLCCPLDFGKFKVHEHWEIASAAFLASTGIRVVRWDRDFLDTQLHNRPEIVARIFSNTIANAFCTAWRTELLIPIDGSEKRGPVARYEQLAANGQVAVEHRVRRSFEEILNAQPALLIRGPSGSGKTITGLHLAAQRPGTRTYYLSLRVPAPIEDYVAEIRTHATFPTVFFIDDCDNFELARAIYDRSNRALGERSSRVRFVFAKASAALRDFAGIAPGLERDLVRAGAKIDLRIDVASFAAHARNLAGALSPRAIARLFRATGGDLFLLDAFITEGAGKNMDTVSPQDVIRSAAPRYFKLGKNYDAFRDLAALGQFGIAPYVIEAPPDVVLPEGALIEVDGSPERYRFAHSSAAEMLFRARLLAVPNGDAVSTTLDAVRRHTENTALPIAERASDLARVLTHELKLRELSDDSSAIVESVVRGIGLDFVRMYWREAGLYLVSRLLIAAARYGVAAPYLSLLQERIDGVKGGEILDDLASSDATQFFLLAIQGPDYAPAVAGLRRWIETALPVVAARLRLSDILGVLSCFTSSPHDSVTRQIHDLDAACLDELAQRSTDLVAFIRAMSALRGNVPAVADAVEECLGPHRLLEIAGDADVLEFLALLRTVSPACARQMLAGADSQFVAGIFARTAEANVSLGTLDISLRDLKEISEDLLDLVIGVLGVQRLRRAIGRSGTVVELLHLVQTIPSRWRDALLRKLDAGYLDDLVSTTIARSRSIGTLDLTFRELRESDASALPRLENAITAARFSRLVEANGTIVGLLSLLKHCSVSFGTELLNRIPSATTDDLIARAVQQDASVSSVPQSLESIRRKSAIIADELEARLTPVRVLSLFRKLGRAGTLADYLAKLSIKSRTSIVQHADVMNVVALAVARSNADGLAHFVTHAGAAFDPRKETFAPLAEVVRNCIRTSEWAPLNRGARMVGDTRPTALKVLFEDELLAWLRTREAMAPAGGDYTEAANQADLYGRKHPDALPAFARRWRSALPQSDADAASLAFMASANAILTPFASAHYPDEGCWTALEMANQGSIADVFDDATSYNLFFYIWPLARLWYERGRPLAATFRSFLNPKIAHALREHVGSLQDRMRYDEIIPRVAIAGLFELFDVPPPVLDGSQRSMLAAQLPPGPPEYFSVGICYVTGLSALGIGPAAARLDDWFRKASSSTRYRGESGAFTYLSETARGRLRIARR